MSAQQADAVNGATNNTRYHEHEHLLWNLKATIESLLAANTSNVWSMYGGLSRLANHLDLILKHGLLQDTCPNEDYWYFVVGLRRIHPVLAPALDQLSRRADQEGRLKGLLWLQDSLENHTLSYQLRTLVSETSHLGKFYSDDAFLRSPSHSSALDTLLQAVEQNNARLLAQVDSKLLQKCPSATGSVASHSSPRLSRATSLSSERDIPHPALQPQRSQDPCFFTSPKGESILDTISDHALGQSQNVKTNSAKDALQALLEGTPSVGGALNGHNVVARATDPLLNRPVASVERESFQRSQQLMRAESDTALVRQRAKMMMGVDENENNQCGLMRKSSSSVASASQSHAMYWEDVAEDLRNGGSDRDAQSRLVFTYDDSPSSSAYAQSIDSSMEEPSSPKQTRGRRSLEPDFRTTGLKHESFRTTNGESDLDRSNEQLLFSEEEGDQFELLGELVRKGRSTHTSVRRRSEDLESETLSPPPQVRQKLRTHSRSKSDQISNVRGGGWDHDRRESLPGTTSHQTRNGKRPHAMHEDKFSSSLPTESYAMRRGSQVGSPAPAHDGYFPQPSQGESLFTFLSSQDFATCPEVDKENAHFCICEAIIAAVEQIKCRQLSRQTPSDHESDASDEEIQQLKQRIRLRRSEKREHKLMLENGNGGSDVDLDRSEQSQSQEQDMSDSDDSMDEAEDFIVTDSAETNLVAMKTEGLTASLGSLYSDADLKRANQMHPLETVIPIGKIEPSSHQSSAETIALSLIKKFSFRQLPAASELDWLVSEKDAPQQLLPLPKSVPISPDDGENADLYKNMRLRGNLEWAPPRPQIVFSIHPPPKRKQLVAKQSYRCAGCGMKVERGFLKRLRYCEYLGKYFCQCCHVNATSSIPARILRKWDFARYPISNFSQELLAKIQQDPVFNVLDINPNLYRKVRQMFVVKNLRKQLFYLKDFLKTCRLCENLKASFDQQPGHWMGQPDLFSLSDLIRVRSGEMEKALNHLVTEGLSHVNQCPLCQAKGFVCELCNKDQIIFPFHLTTTYQCPDCWACYHKPCFPKDSKCPKCERILARQSLIAVKSVSSDEEPVTPTPY